MVYKRLIDMQMLKKIGIRAKAVDSVQRVLRALEEHYYDTVLMDIGK